MSVLSGNRNFEGRINPDVKMNYLASPPLCVAYALAGTMDIDLLDEPLGQDKDGADVYLKDIWPSAEDVAHTVEEAVQSDMFTSSYGEVFEGDERWNSLEVPEGERFAWADDSTYVRQPPFFDDLPPEPEPVGDIEGAKVLAVLGDSVTTDHISPAGAIKKDSPAAKYLNEHGVENKDFNSYGSRRGNHEVMMRGTFANIRLRNFIAGKELIGGLTLYEGDELPIYDAAMKYAEQGTPLVVLAGKEYGSGSSRDWAAKGTRLLGVRAVIAESFERIHRSNLVGMGVLPLQFNDGDSAESLGLTGEEEFSITGIEGGEAKEVDVRAGDIEFKARVRIDTPKEVAVLPARRDPPVRAARASGWLSCPLHGRTRDASQAADRARSLGLRAGSGRRLPRGGGGLRRDHARHDRLDGRAREGHRRGAARGGDRAHRRDRPDRPPHRRRRLPVVHGRRRLGPGDPRRPARRDLDARRPRPRRGRQEADPPAQGGGAQEGAGAQGPAHRHRREGRRRRALDGARR